MIITQVSLPIAARSASLALNDPESADLICIRTAFNLSSECRCGPSYSRAYPVRLNLSPESSGLSLAIDNS